MSFDDLYAGVLRVRWTLIIGSRPPVNSAPIPFAGRATSQGGMLRVEGQARYPNDFSTATLEPLPGAMSGSPTCQAYALVFHRDKEPFCGPDGIGPVVYYGRAAHLTRVTVVRVYVTPEWYEDIAVERGQVT